MSLPGRVEIYALTAPDSGEVRYIGKARDAVRRLAGHLRDQNRRDTPVYRWMRKLGRSPGLRVLATCPAAEWQAVERAEIAQARKSGVRLLNVAAGGDEPACSREVRARNGRKVAATRDKQMWALKRALGDSLKRGHVSEPAKEKMRQRPDVFGQFAQWL